MGPLCKFFFLICLARRISAYSDNFTEELYKLTNEILEKYFQVFKCVTFAAEEVRNGDRLRRELPAVVIGLSGRGGPFSREELLTAALEEGCGGVVVQAGAAGRAVMVGALVDAKRRAVSHRYNRERYLLLPASRDDGSAEVLEDERMFFLPNLLLVVPVGGGGRFAVRGHGVFGAGVEELWSGERGWERGRELYPDRIRDVGGKRLVLGLMHYVPYSVIVQEGNETIYDGVESRIAEQFVETINGTFEGLDHPVEMWGNKFPNGSGNGIFGSVQRHDADLGYSAIYQWYCDVLDCSYPYIQAEVICLVPRPRVLASGTTILLPFATSTWVAFFVAFFVCSGFVLGITLASRRLTGAGGPEGFLITAFHSTYHVFRLQLNQVPRFAHENNALATFMKIVLFYHFSLSVFWQGGIASILTVPRYEKPIDSAEDLVASWPQVQWGANHDVWIHSIENSTEPVLHDIVKKFVILDEDTLVKKTRTRDFAFFMEKLPNKHYGFSPYINEETVPFLRLMKHNIYTGFAVMILPRGSPYTEKLDRVIHWLFATGITQKMENQVSLERINNHLQVMIRHSNEKEGGRVILTLAHIRGPLFIYFVGTFTALKTVAKALLAGLLRTALGSGLDLLRQVSASSWLPEMHSQHSEQYTREPKSAIFNTRLF